jgi:hypothetical protein
MRLRSVPLEACVPVGQRVRMSQATADTRDGPPASQPPMRPG